MKTKAEIGKEMLEKRKEDSRILNLKTLNLNNRSQKYINQWLLQAEAKKQ
jgi:hypothetical protein